MSEPRKGGLGPVRRVIKPIDWAVNFLPSRAEVVETIRIAIAIPELPRPALDKVTLRVAGGEDVEVRWTSIPRRRIITRSSLTIPELTLAARWAWDLEGNPVVDSLAIALASEGLPPAPEWIAADLPLRLNAR